MDASNALNFSDNLRFIMPLSWDIAQDRTRCVQVLVCGLPLGDALSTMPGCRDGLGSRRCSTLMPEVSVVSLLVVGGGAPIVHVRLRTYSGFYMYTRHIIFFIVFFGFSNLKLLHLVQSIVCPLPFAPRPFAHSMLLHVCMFCA